MRLEVVTFPMLDTGIGREAGFRDDAHLIEVARAEREALDPISRSIADEVNRKMELAFINGDGS